MFCPHCGENSSSSDWVLDDGYGALSTIAEAEDDDGWLDFDSYETATCPACSVASYIDKLIEHNS